VAALLIWSLWGLWVWLDHYGKRPSEDGFLTFICGPAAWLTAFWRLFHEPKRRKERRFPEVQRKFWGDN
jgi:hypothetical protein